MGLFGFGDKKKKNSGIRNEILKELGSINSSTMDINRLVSQLESIVNEHQIIGTKDETKVLEDLLGKVASIRSSVNAGKASSARTAINQTIDYIGKEWRDSVHQSNEKVQPSFQGSLDDASDEFEKTLKRYNELLAVYNSAPDYKKQSYVAELKQLKMKLQNLQTKIAFQTQNLTNAATNEALDEQLAMQAEAKKLQQQQGISAAELQSKSVELQSARAEQQQINEQSEALNQMLFADASLGNMEFQPFDQSFATNQFQEFGATGTSQSTGSMGNSQVQESANIKEARKKAEINLEKLEAANEELKDQLAEKNREYRRLADKARELLAKRKNMSQAEYKTIDHQIDELKVKMISLSREIDSYQNVLQQNNLKVALLNQLKTENNLDIVNKLGANLSTASMEEISQYLYGKGKQKEEDLANLDAAAGGVLNSSVNSLTSMTEGFSSDTSDLEGDKDKYNEFEKLLQRQ